MLSYDKVDFALCSFNLAEEAIRKVTFSLQHPEEGTLLDSTEFRRPRWRQLYLEFYRAGCRIAFLPP